MLYIYVMDNLNFPHHYSSLHANLVLMKHFFFMINVGEKSAALYFCGNSDPFSGFFDELKLTKMYFN